MSKTWPKDVIRELLTLAQEKGESKATLADEEEVKLFRFAIYNFRRSENFGYDINITIDGSTVVLRKKEYPKINILQAESGSYL